MTVTVASASAVSLAHVPLRSCSRWRDDKALLTAQVLILQLHQLTTNKQPDRYLRTSHGSDYPHHHHHHHHIYPSPWSNLSWRTT